MVCPKCGSSNVTVQVVNETYLKNVHHSIIWWLLISWWWLPIKWLILTVPALIFKIFGIGKKKKIENKQKAVAVCQECGNTFNTTN